jgi:hypothetical protein
MGRYVVKFFKNLLSSDGHQFKVLQRATSVKSNDAEDAVRTAQRRFERLEHVPDWHLHADYVETAPNGRSEHPKKVA